MPKTHLYAGPCAVQIGVYSAPSRILPHSFKHMLTYVVKEGCTFWIPTNQEGQGVDCVCRVSSETCILSSYRMSELMSTQNLDRFAKTEFQEHPSLLVYEYRSFYSPRHHTDDSECL